MTTCFISGHLSLTEEEFEIHYRELIDYAIAAGHDFVVGDAPGADTIAQKYLAEHVSRERVVVYHAYTSPRNANNFRMVGNFPSQNAKDKAMTLASDYDILWIRPGREDSGTARNLERRKKALEGRIKP